MIRRLALGLGAVLLLTGCGANSGDDDGRTGTSEGRATADGTGDDEAPDGADAPAGGGELTIFAAASLTIVFDDIADLFAAQTGAEVRFSFAGSSDLVAQLDAGAPADVLATANESTMADAVDNGTIASDPEHFAANVLTLITPAGNPAGVTGVDESLEDADLVICAPQVPCGAATAMLADILGVTLDPVSEANNVTDVLGMVAAGQADAGLVYTTDAVSAGGDVDIIDIPGADDVVNTYPIAVTTGAADPALAAQWVEFVQGPQAQELLADAGFAAP